MKFSPSIVAAAAAIFAVGVAAHGDRSPLGPQTARDVTQRLFNMTRQVEGLRKGFMASLQGNGTVPDDAVASTLALQATLNDTVVYLSHGSDDVCDNFGIKDSQKVRGSYRHMAENITAVTVGLRQNVQGLRASGRARYVDMLLPDLEDGFDKLFENLKDYISEKILPSVARIHKQLDDEFEKTLKAYLIHDKTDDDNPISTSKDFQVGTPVHADPNNPGTDNGYTGSPVTFDPATNQPVTDNGYTGTPVYAPDTKPVTENTGAPVYFDPNTGKPVADKTATGSAMQANPANGQVSESTNGGSADQQQKTATGTGVQTDSATGKAFQVPNGVMAPTSN